MLLSACASAPVEFDQARSLHAELTQLQADPALASHLQFMADREISIARRGGKQVGH
jgi:hypothetical protein